MSSKPKDRHVSPKSETMLRHASRLAKIGYWVRDERVGRIIYFSDQMAEINGIEPCEYLERLPPDHSHIAAVHPADRERYDSTIVNARSEAKIYYIEYRIVTADGQERFVREIGEPKLTSSGEAGHYVGSLQDITDVKKREIELEKTRDRLERQDAEMAELTENLRWSREELAVFKKRFDPAALDKHLQTTAKTARPARILLAEDSHVNRMLITTMLQKMGHTTKTVTNGREAVEAVSKDTFDLVLMDIQMPEMDGPTATGHIRKLGGARARIPIIALTADTMQKNQQRYLAAGLDQCLTKPVDWTELGACIDKITKSG
ncbi:MAG: response regulator [Pseudomonadota bacterium]|nr:response regulator [Pseudomonadota bacterium]